MKKQDQDHIFLYLKTNIHKQNLLAFRQGGDGVFKYQNMLCVSMVDEIQERIMEEDCISRYYIHLGSTKMYRDLIEVY